MARKKKRKIRWSGVALLTLYVATIVAVLYFLISGLVSLIHGWVSPATADSADTTKVSLHQGCVDPSLLDADSLTIDRVQKLIERSTRLDSTALAVSLYDLTTSRQLISLHADEPMVPASCMKIPTALAAIKLLGLDYRYRTTVDVCGEMDGDTLLGQMRLRASDDPIITSFDSLTHQIKASGIVAVSGNIEFELQRIDTLSSHPSTMSWDITWPKIPLLLRGKAHVEKEFYASLAKAGILVRHPKKEASPQASGSPDDAQACSESPDDISQEPWREVARIETPLTDVLTPMLIHSSNVKAEAVFFLLDRVGGYSTDKQIHWDSAHAVSQYWTNQFGSPSMLQKVERIVSVARETGIIAPVPRESDEMLMVDGSGLSPLNRLTAHRLTRMLQLAWNDNPIREYLIGEALASPGDELRRGSLKGRLSDAKFRNRIFVKTGTLTTKGVSSLAGYIHGTDDHWYAFSIINNDAPVAEGRLFQDDFCKCLVR